MTAYLDLENPDLAHKQNIALIAGGQQQPLMMKSVVKETMRHL